VDRISALGRGSRLVDVDVRAVAVGEEQEAHLADVGVTGDEVGGEPEEATARPLPLITGMDLA
jgi:hypothetical protein